MTYTNYAMRRLTTYTARLEARHKRLVEAARAVLPAIRWGMTHQPGNLNQWTDCEAQIEAALKAEEEP